MFDVQCSRLETSENAFSRQDKPKDSLRNTQNTTTQWEQSAYKINSLYIEQWKTLRCLRMKGVNFHQEEENN
uniref:Uncharacterized protein n=1 Tax=Heterorhabditis bacteriophora TaxID=37862 RepID=A0A1I7WPY3_HETBA